MQVVDDMEMASRLGCDYATLAEFCRRHEIEHCALFGSVLRPDFTGTSDVDVVVAFRRGRTPSLVEHIRIERLLADMFHRSVDLVTFDSVLLSENELLRNEILSSLHTVYAE